LKPSYSKQLINNNQYDIVDDRPTTGNKRNKQNNKNNLNIKLEPLNNKNINKNLIIEDDNDDIYSKMNNLKINYEININKKQLPPMDLNKK